MMPTEGTVLKPREEIACYAAGSFAVAQRIGPGLSIKRFEFFIDMPAMDTCISNVLAKAQRKRAVSDEGAKQVWFVL